MNLVIVRSVVALCKVPKSVKLMRTALLALLSTLTCSLTLQATAVAQEVQDDVPTVSGDSGRDAPSRVARLSYVDGKVVMAPAGTEEWADALLNRPLTTGDRVWVDQGGKSELQVGSSTVYLDEESGFSFLDLDDDLLHMSLTDGAATIRVRRKFENESIQVETPNATVTLLHPGEYHIQISEDGAATVVSTRSGESRVEGEEDTFTVRAKERGVFRGTRELTADIGALGPRTSFEDWANDRERRDQRSVSSKYVSREVIGYEDLDENGDWVSDPEYGYVWRPRHVVAGWAPYRFGRWVWVSPWGWSWVDSSPWGFAPFHYGRWAYVRSDWCWVPGPRHLRPVYAPALVAWVGGSGVSVSVSLGSGIGWFPLGPREVYVPSYWYSRRYIQNVNVSNTIIINNTYVNNVYAGRGGNFDYRYGRSPRAVTVVTRDRFVGGRPIDGHIVNVREPDLQRWRQDGRAPAIAPVRDSVLGAQPAARRPPVRSGQLDTRRTAPQRVSFDAERRAIEANNGRPVDRSQILKDSSGRGSRAGSNTARVERNRTDGAARVDRTDRANASDRPQWARQRGEARDSSRDASRESFSGGSRAPAQRQQQASPSARNSNAQPADQSAPGSSPRIDRDTRGNRAGESRGGAEDRPQEQAERRVERSSEDVAARARAAESTSSRGERSAPQSQYTAPSQPREARESRPVSEQPARQQPERAAQPERARAAPERKKQSRPNNDDAKEERPGGERSNR